jgi:site-specific recombinase XerD
VETFTQAQINTLLEQAQATSYRDYCIVFLALDSGLRKRELIALTLEDVNVLTGMVTVRHGKGDKYRQVRVGELCRKVLWRYVNQYRKPDDKAETVFFLSERGTPLSYYTLGTVMTRLSQKCGFRVTCHKCRHTFATNLARKFPNAFLIAQVLGHADLETSKGYIHLAAADVSAVFSPMDDLLGPK